MFSLPPCPKECFFAALSLWMPEELACQLPGTHLPLPPSLQGITDSRTPCLSFPRFLEVQTQAFHIFTASPFIHQDITSAPFSHSLSKCQVTAKFKVPWGRVEPGFNLNISSDPATLEIPTSSRGFHGLAQGRKTPTCRVSKPKQTRDPFAADY